MKSNLSLSNSKVKYGPAKEQLKKFTTRELKNMIKPISIKKQCDSVIDDSQAILNRKISLQEDFGNRGIPLPFDNAKFDVALLKNKYKN